MENQELAIALDLFTIKCHSHVNVNEINTKTRKETDSVPNIPVKHDHRKFQWILRATSLASIGFLFSAALYINLQLVNIKMTAFLSYSCSLPDKGPRHFSYCWGQNRVTAFILWERVENSPCRLHFLSGCNLRSCLVPSEADPHWLS